MVLNNSYTLYGAHDLTMNLTHVHISSYPDYNITMNLNYYITPYFDYDLTVNLNYFNTPYSDNDLTKILSFYILITLIMT